MYESISASCGDNLAAWFKHVDGAATFVKMHDKDQLHTPMGQSMFFQCFADSLSRSYHLFKVIPAHLHVLHAIIGQDIDETQSCVRAVVFCA